ncbi:MAG: DUF4491 family protein [Coriobacteriales bacterium]|jgi:molybdopterin synthase catalytic subunit|nr:DUF4491 family protein [Coriobacteriales bacterium]
MNVIGILVGLGAFVIIGVFHPIVTKTEFYLGKKMWPLFLVFGALACAGSLFVQNAAVSALLAVLGFTSFWSIKELFEQEERVRKGWFPPNPKRGHLQTVEPSLNQWLLEAKASPEAAQCGMFLSHNGVVRVTPKQQVREGVEGLGEVCKIEFSYDAVGVDAAVAEALTWPGVSYVKVWLNEGILSVGDSIMYVLIGADIRPNCIDALQKLVGTIKTELVVEKEIYV